MEQNSYGVGGARNGRSEGFSSLVLCYKGGGSGEEGVSVSGEAR